MDSGHRPGETSHTQYAIPGRATAAPHAGAGALSGPIHPCAVGAGAETDHPSPAAASPLTEHAVPTATATLAKHARAGVPTCAEHASAAESQICSMYCRRRRSSTSGVRASCARPTSAFSGVRISWLVLARNALLAWLAASAASRAAASA